MRVGIVTGEYPPMQGGVGAYTAILAQHLVDCGQEIRLFSTCSARSDSLPLTNNITHWHFATLKTIKDWARQQQLDLINLQFQTAAYQMSPWIHFLPDVIRQPPVITTFHDLRFPYLFPKAGPLRNWIVMHLAHRSAGVILTNHEDAMQVKHLAHTQLIPIGSNILDNLPSSYDKAQWRAQAGAASRDFLLTYFGLINRSKGLDTLLQSLAKLRSKGVPARLLIIGGTSGSSDPTNRAYISEIEHLIHNLGLEAYIQRTGFIEDEAEVGSYLRASDAVVLPFADGASFRRGSLMAAVHYACPIVTTRPRVLIPEFVHGQNMLLVPPSDHEALTATLRQLYQMPERGQSLRESARQLAQHFDWQQIARDYVSFFERVLRGAA